MRSRVVLFSASFLLSGCVALPLLAGEAAVAGGSIVAAGAITKSTTSLYARQAGKVTQTAALANTQANVGRATAQATGSRYALEQIQVSNVVINTDPSVDNATWVADTPGGRFSCSSTLPVLMGTAYCKRVGR